MSIPAILGASLLKLKEIEAMPIINIVAGLVAAGTGYVAILLVLRLLKNQKFYYFGFWCLLMGILGIVLFI